MADGFGESSQRALFLNTSLSSSQGSFPQIFVGVHELKLILQHLFQYFILSCKGANILQ